MFVIFHLGEMRFMAELETNGLTIQDLTNSTDHQGVNLEGMLNFFKWCVLGCRHFCLTKQGYIIYQWGATADQPPWADYDPAIDHPRLRQAVCCTNP